MDKNQKTNPTSYSKNGQFIDYNQGIDRGLLYGDGVFTTIRFCHGQFHFQQQHWQRLCDDARKLSIQPLSYQQFCLTLGLHRPQNEKTDSICRVTLTRKFGQGYRGKKNSDCNIYCSVMPYKPWPDSLKLKLCKSRLSRNKMLAGVKHLNRLEQVLASQELDNSFDEGLVMDTRGYLIEGTMSNVIGFNKSHFYTPSIKFAGVNGIAKQALMKSLVEQGESVIEGEFEPSWFLDCEAIWLCNSVRGVKPVATVLDLEQKIVEFRSSPHSIRLTQNMEELATLTLGSDYS